MSQDLRGGTKNFMNKVDINKIKEFNKRWNITSDSSYEEEFIKFKTRVLNIFSNIDSHVTEEGIATFCQIMGISEKWEHERFGYRRWSENIINSLIKENDEKKFYFILQAIFDLPIVTDYGYPNSADAYSKEILFNRLEEAISLSNINLAITVKNGEVILYPAGEKIFDQELVDGVLSFLNNESQKHFIEALKFYEKKNLKDAIKSAESLRRALEEFLRFKLKNQQGLDKNIKDLQSKLKTDKKDPAIRTIIFQIFSYLDQYFNENSKHKDGNIDEPENEYLIYQTGTLMRYINSVLK